jgi:hypothetical protein
MTVKESALIAANSMSEGANAQRRSEQKELDSSGEQQRSAGSYREAAAVEGDNESGGEVGNYPPNGDEDGAGGSDRELREGDDPRYGDEELEVTDFDEKPAGCSCEMYVEGGIALWWQYDEECPVSKGDHEAVYNLIKVILS